MVWNRLLIALVLWVCFDLAEAQVNRYAIYFKDKEENGFSIDVPEAFLSQKAIERRNRFGLEITEDDLPVSQKYVNELGQLDIEVYFKSKWLNLAIVEMDYSLIQAVEGLYFVKKVELVSEGSQLGNAFQGFEIPVNFEQPDLDKADTEFQLGLLNIDDMHSDGYNGEGITIAVLDAGFPSVNTSKVFEHLFIEDRINATIDFVGNTGNPFQYSGHGTSVFSVLAGNFETFKGSAFKSNFLLYVTEDVKSETRVEEYNWLLAAEHADSAGVDIIQSSLGYCDGFSLPEMNYTQQDLDGKTTIVSIAAQMAIDRGILVVNSAGNERNSAWQLVTPPSDVEYVLSVGGITGELELAPFSSVGPTSDGRIKPDVVALGTSVAIVNSSGNVTLGNGTSYSSPIVAGMAAGFWQANPEMTNIEMVDFIRSISSRSNDPDSLFGYGIPDYLYNSDEKMILLSDIVDKKITVYPNPFNGKSLTIKSDLLQGNEVGLLLIDINGKTIDEFQGKLDSDIYVWDLPDLTNGIYFLKMQMDTITREVKLIKN